MSIYESWQTEKSIVKSIDRRFDEQNKELWTKDEQALKQYALGENPFKDPVPPNNHASPPFFVDVMLAFTYSGRPHALAMKSIFSLKTHGDWLQHYREFAAADFWQCTLDHHRPHASMSLTQAMSTISDCLYLGWMDKTQLLVEEVHSAYGAKRFFDVNGIFSQPLYHFLLRICFDWCQLKFDGWGIGYYDAVTDPHAPGQCLGEPVLNELFAHWKDPDLSGMLDQMKWLCDYYTHRTANKDGTEFGNDLLHTRFPALILSWFRLRESLGLNNPIIDHPLMRSHYVRLPPPQPFYTDYLLDGVIARLRREELPNLGIVPARIVPKGAPTEPKRSLLAKFLDK